MTRPPVSFDASLERDASGTGESRAARDGVTSDDAPLLSATGLRKSFGGVHAVDGVDLDVARGETLGLIGPNGAGKTTLFELLGGFTKPDAGRVSFAGHDITSRSPERRAELGLIRSFQDAALFPTLTVLETIQLAFERRHPTATLRVAARVRVAPTTPRTTARSSSSTLMGLGDYADKQTRSCRRARGASPSSPVSSRWSRRCCCSTSRRLASPSARPRRSASCSPVCKTTSTPPSSSSSTTCR